MLLQHRRSWPGRARLACVLASLAAAAAMTPRSAWAAPIIWSAAQTVSADADVSLAGDLVCAYTIGEEGVPFTIVNGVRFEPFEFPIGGTNATVGSVTFTESPGVLDASLGLGSTAPPFVNLSPAYQVLLYSGGFASNANVITATLGDLTPGQQYLLQVWTSNASLFTPGVGTLQQTTLAATNQVTLDANTSDLDGGLGQFVVGRFTADAVTQEFTLAGANVPTNLPLINALQVRAVPEPSTSCMILAGLAAAACLPGRLTRRGGRERRGPPAGVSSTVRSRPVTGRSRIGAERFELSTSWSQTKRASQTALRPAVRECTRNRASRPRGIAPVARQAAARDPESVMCSSSR